MTKAKEIQYTDFVLPSSVVTRVDVSRLVSETERLDNLLTAAAARKKIKRTRLTKPKMSEQLSEFLDENELEITESRKRSQLIKQLRLLKTKVPVVHMTFAVAADPESLAMLVSWFRKSVHPQAVISVGLQPRLVAGVHLRTTNQVYDLSLKARVEASRGILAEELGALRGDR